MWWCIIASLARSRSVLSVRVTHRTLKWCAQRDDSLTHTHHHHPTPQHHHTPHTHKNPPLPLHTHTHTHAHTNTHSHSHTHTTTHTAPPYTPHATHDTSRTTHRAPAPAPIPTPAGFSHAQCRGVAWTTQAVGFWLPGFRIQRNADRTRDSSSCVNPQTLGLF